MKIGVFNGLSNYAPREKSIIPIKIGKWKSMPGADET